MITRTAPILTEYEKAIMDRINSTKALEKYLKTQVPPDDLVPAITKILAGQYDLLAICRRMRD